MRQRPVDDSAGPVETGQVDAAEASCGDQNVAGVKIAFFDAGAEEHGHVHLRESRWDARFRCQHFDQMDAGPWFRGGAYSGQDADAAGVVPTVRDELQQVEITSWNLHEEVLRGGSEPLRHVVAFGFRCDARDQRR